jgi:hypothetical protein
VNALLSFLATLLADEFKSWLPWITQRVVRHAVGILPKDHQERFQEEWHSHLDEIPGELAKLFVALDLIRSAFVISHPDLLSEIFDRTVALILLTLLAPFLAGLIVWKKYRAHGERVIFASPCYSNARPVKIYGFMVLGPSLKEFSPYASLHWFDRMTPLTEAELQRLLYLMRCRYRGWKWIIKIHIAVRIGDLPRLVNIVRGDIPLRSLFALFAGLVEPR